MRSPVSLKLLAALALLGTPALAQTPPPPSEGPQSPPPASNTQVPASGLQTPPGTAASSAPDANTRTLDSHRWRASALMEQKLYASTNETIGEIQDLVFTPEGGLTAIVEVGGFLGSGKKLVAIPYNRLQHSERWLLPGATKESVAAMPEFKFD